METKDYPNCGRNMIKEHSGQMLASNPPQSVMMWWCGCGRKQRAETRDYPLTKNRVWRGGKRQIQAPPLAPLPSSRSRMRNHPGRGKGQYRPLLITKVF